MKRSVWKLYRRGGVNEGNSGWTSQSRFVAGLIGVALTVFLVAQGTAIAIPLSSGLVERPPELIIFLRASPLAAIPEDVVARVNDRRPVPGLLGLGNPVSARFVLPYRAAGETLEILRARPDSPRAVIERAFVLSYPFGTGLGGVRQGLLADSTILDAAQNEALSFSVSPSDPLFAVTGSPLQYQWGPYRLNLPQAWDRVKGNAYLGAVDAGLQTNHPDLQAFSSSGVFLGGNFRPHLSWDFVFNDSNADELQNGLGVLGTSAAGHGTHVSGILAGTSNNSQGVAGTCWNCSLLMGKQNSLPDRQLAATTWLVDHGVQVINMSFGDSSGFLGVWVDPCNPPQAGFSRPVLCPGLDFAEERGVLVVAASGNAKSDINFPASDPRVVAVGGVRSDGLFWEESCFGDLCGSNYTKTSGRKMQDLVAPAKDVLSTVYTGRDWITTPIVCGDGAAVDGYGLCTGTSMAAPFVSGIAGLLRSANPLLSRADTRRLLVENTNRSAVGLGWEFKYGYGVPDAAAAVAKAMGTSRGQVLANRLTPLFSFYSAMGTDSFYTIFPQMAAAALFGQLDEFCAARNSPNVFNCSSSTPYSSVGPAVSSYPQFPGFSCLVSPASCAWTPRASVYVFTSQAPPFTGAPPLVPLYRMSYNPQRNGGTSPNRDVTYTTDTTGLLAFRSVGYELDGIEGYIYKRCTPEPQCIPAGAVRLYRLYNVSRDDYAIFPDSELAQKQAESYVSSPGLNDWMGYVYPNVDQDGDQLIDGFEILIGTNPARADSDCDGRTDGQEVLQFPYSDPRSGPCGV